MNYSTPAKVSVEILVGEDRFELPKPEATRLQRAGFNHLPTRPCNFNWWEVSESNRVIWFFRPAHRPRMPTSQRYNDGQLSLRRSLTPIIVHHQRTITKESDSIVSSSTPNFSATRYWEHTLGSDDGARTRGL